MCAGKRGAGTTPVSKARRAYCRKKYDAQIRGYHNQPSYCRRRRGQTILVVLKKVEEFNQTCPIGWPCRYWLGDRRGRPTGIAEVLGPATVMGGTTPVAWLRGVDGGLPFSLVEPLSPAEVERRYDRARKLGARILAARERGRS